MAFVLSITKKVVNMFLLFILEIKLPIFYAQSC